MLGRTDSRPRLLFLLLAIVTIAGGMTLRLAYWQVVQRQELVDAARNDAAITDTRPAIRGTIYDRTGRVVLAKTVFRDRLIASPYELSRAERTQVAGKIVDILGLSGDTAAALREAMTTDSHWVVLASNLPADASQRIRDGLADGTLNAVMLEPQAVRVYPQSGGAPATSLAAHLLGFVNADGKGQYGIEQAYDSLLAGQPEIDVIDPSLPLEQSTQIRQHGVAGQDIRLTIDAGLQLALEQEVYAAWAADKAKNVSVIAMDPRSGAILADASYPSFDGNLYTQIAATDPGRFVDPVVSQVYEPGSVFKMLLASAGLESGATTLDTKINDYGVLRLASGNVVGDANLKSMGWLKFSDIVAYSRNVGVTQVAFKLGSNVDAASKALYAAWRRYGIGSPTGVDLAGEVSAAQFVRDPSKTRWRDIDLANGSFGQGVAATPMQMMRAYACMMNGGSLITPYVAQPGAAAAQASAIQGVISPALSSRLTWLMGHVVSTVPWYRVALIPGYVVGGKTGTAQIWDPAADGGKGAWRDDIYNYSYYGFVGRTGPDVAIGIVINEGTPKFVRQGNLPLAEESYQLFRRAAWDTITTLQIPAAPPSTATPSSSPGAPSSSPSAPDASPTASPAPATNP